jgi:transposase
LRKIARYALFQLGAASLHLPVREVLVAGWLTSRLVPDHKTIADFRKDSGPAIKQVCVQFVELCRLMDLLTKASVAIDGSKFKAVNTCCTDRLNSPPRADKQQTA